MSKHYFRRRTHLQQLTLLYTVVWLASPKAVQAAANCCAENPDATCTPTRIYSCPPDLFEPPPCNSGDDCKPCPPGDNSGSGDEGSSFHGRSDKHSSRQQGPKGPVDTSCKGCHARGAGLAYYWVTEPNINVRIADVPWGYVAGRGLPVNFHLSYRQRGSYEPGNNVFGIGPNWSFSLRAFVCVATNNQGLVGIREHRGGAGMIAHQMSQHEYRTHSYPTLPSASSCVIEKADGAKDIYGFPYTNSAGSVLLFLTEKRDWAGNALTYSYS